MPSALPSSESTGGVSVSSVRATILDSIEFRGVIRGCRDHQWLIADALLEMSAGPTQEVPVRWVIASHDPSVDPLSASTGVFTTGPASPASPALVARDRLTGWTASASSPAALAARIRQAFGDGSWPDAA